VKRIEVRSERTGKEVAIKAENENEMKGLAIGNEIGSAREFANKNEKGILRGRNTIALKPGRGKEKEKEKRKGKHRKNVSAKGRRRMHGKEKRSENAKRKRNESVKRREDESAKEKWKGKGSANANATVKKSAIDIENANGDAIDTMTGNAENERRNATKKETVQGSANQNAKKRREKKDLTTYPRTHPKLRTEFET